MVSRAWVLGAVVACLTLLGGITNAAEGPASIPLVRRLSVTPPALALAENRSRQQLLVTAEGTDGYHYDATRLVRFVPADPAIAQVDSAGVVRPRRSGATKITVTGLGQTTEVSVTVGNLVEMSPVSFTNEVQGVLGKAGCNAGACHGHNSGKGGFKLSLRGYDGGFDYLALTRGYSGRRVDFLRPEQSLMLRKPTMALAHGGGQRLMPGSDSYRLLQEWLTQGGKEDVGRAPRVDRIEVSPDRRLAPRIGLSQQLTVQAHFADGTARDVTEQAIYELSHDGVVEVSPQGIVTALREGEAAVLVRFLGRMAISRFVVIQHKPDFAWTTPPEHKPRLGTAARTGHCRAGGRHAVQQPGRQRTAARCPG